MIYPNLMKFSEKQSDILNFEYNKKVLNILPQRSKRQRQMEEPGLVLDADLAMIWLSLGDKDKGFHHLFRCVERKMGPVAIIIEFPTFKVPKDDPRYRLLKEMLNLTEYI